MIAHDSAVLNAADLNALSAACKNRVEQRLEVVLPSPQSPPARLHEAMRYAALGGGKRIRPTLVYAAGRCLGIAPDLLDAAAVAVELIHAYSLVHDDLPAMDDDDLRRGRPTCHKAFDEATAILAADAQQALAFQLLAADRSVSARTRVQRIEILARAAGSLGMVGGQMLDLESEGRKLDLVMLENIHIHKTGALIRASVNMAATTLGELDPADAEALDHYAKCIGLAFQIRDDLLDVEGNTAVIGKRSGADETHRKATYPALMGLGPAKEAAADLIEDALGSLQRFDAKADPLRWIATYIVERDR